MSGAWRTRIVRGLVILASGPSFVSLPAHAEKVVELTTARAVSGPAAQAARPQEVDFRTGADVALPDNWKRTRPGETSVAWYSVPLDAALQTAHADAARSGLAVVVPRVADRGEFWLNGERLESGSGAGFTRNRTLWVLLPPGAFKPQANTLEVRVSGTADLRAGLSAMEFGHAADLRPGYEARRFLQTTVPLMVVFVAVAALFAAVPLWLKTRRRAHLLFVLLCVSWLPRTIVVMGPDAGPPSAAGLLFVLVSSLLASATVALLVLEYMGAHGRFWQRYRRWLLGCMAASWVAGAIAAALGQLTVRVVIMLHWPFYAMMLLILLAQIRAAFLAPRAANVFMAAALTAWAVTVLHDLAQVADFAGFDSFFWAPSAVLLLFLALIWRTIEVLALARGSADHEVRHAVTQAATEHGQALEQLRAEFDRTQESERQAVIATERTRLLHDLHDGMGGQLITAVRMARREDVPRADIARVIEDSLEDMRLIIDSLDLDEFDLLPLLGNLRYRLEPRLNAIGVSLHWEAEPLPDLDYLTPETGLAIVRIVQEAVNNALRHGAARTITVSVLPAADAVELRIADDGTGFDTDRPVEPGAAHRGLNAMRSRAQKLGGVLAITSGADGTRIVLRLPLRR